MESEPVIYRARVPGYAGIALVGALFVIVVFFAGHVLLSIGAPLWNLAPVVVICALAGVMLAALDIRLTRRELCCSLTFGLFRKCIPLSEIVSVEAAHIFPLGLGYRIGPHSKAWIVSGGHVVRVRTVHGETLTFNAPDTEYLCRKIEELRQARAAT